MFIPPSAWFSNSVLLAVGVGFNMGFECNEIWEEVDLAKHWRVMGFSYYVLSHFVSISALDSNLNVIVLIMK
jgi:hypothetical protein